MRLDFWNKGKKARDWGGLSADEKKLVTSRMVTAVKAMSGARYKIVSGSDVYQREQGVAERFGEDEILNASKRGKLLDLTRNAMRNNSTLNTVLKQFDLHGVSNQGGKAVFSFQDSEYQNEVREAFARWTRNADFFDGMNLNTLLKIILKTEIVGGDCVLIFDDGLVTDSGKVILIEPDEIGNTTPEALAEHYGKGAYQSLGRVYTPYGQFQGCVVSRSQRGEEIFDPAKSWFLHRNPDGNQLEECWMMPRNVFRIAQGRGVSPTTSSLATLIDLEDYVANEIATSKLNAKMLAQVIQDKSQEPDAVIPSAFDDVDFSGMSDAEIEQAVKEVADSAEQTVTLDQMRAAGTIYQVMPEGTRLELLQKNSPNPNSIDWVRWLASRSASPFGLTNVYATLKCDTSYTAFRGEQIMAQPAFEEAQKFLEQICDWILYRWAAWAIRKGVIADKLEPNWLRKVSWLWDKMKDVDVVKEQTAIGMMLKNGTSSYAEILGSDWKEKLSARAEEIAFCREHGLEGLHPALQTANGTMIETDLGDEEE